MQMTRETSMRNRLARRLRSARGTGYLEFALIVPLAMMLLCFAADFTRILRTEQQLEIAARAAVDLEAHHRPVLDNAEWTPTSFSKVIAKYYLVDVAKVTDDVKYVYLKGDAFSNHNPLTVVVNIVNKYLFDPNTVDGGGNMFWEIFTAFMRGVAKVLTMGCDAYLLQTPKRDRGIRMTASVAIPTLLPDFLYSFYASRKNKRILVAQYEPTVKSGKYPDPTKQDFQASTSINDKLSADKRHRFYVSMPVLDPVPLAVDSIIKDIRSWSIIKPFL